MPLRKEVTHATDVELLTVILGNCRTADPLLKKASGSLFALLHSTPHENGDLLCAQGSSAYAGDPVTKLQAARELAARAIAERLSQRDALTSPSAVRDTYSSTDWEGCRTRFRDSLRNPSTAAPRATRASWRSQSRWGAYSA